MQWLRRSVQVFTLFFIVTIPLLHLYSVDRYAHKNFAGSLAEQQITKKNVFQEKSVYLLSSILNKLDDPDKIINSISGSPWAVRIFGYTIADPLAAATLSVSGASFHWPFLLAITIPVILTVLLGRVFCGWICPYHLIAEINSGIRRFLVRTGVFSHHSLNITRAAKYLTLLLLLTLSFAVGISVIPRIYPPIVISAELFNIAYFGTIGFGVFFILFLLVTELMLFDRWWCRHVCPGGALYSLMGSLRVVRIVRLDKKCTLCGECDKACPFGLLPMTDQLGMECDNCGMCRSSCGEDALKYDLLPLWKVGNIADKHVKSNGKEKHEA